MNGKSMFICGMRARARVCVCVCVCVCVGVYNKEQLLPSGHFLITIEFSFKRLSLYGTSRFKTDFVQQEGDT